MIGRTNVGGGGGGQTWSIRGWCNTVGLSYGLLDAITEADMRTLMTKYASVAYFREWYSNEPSMIDQFIANAYAMKWIGLRDYICDKLMAVADFKTKALSSDNWEYILKDHVPVMTSNTAPYGEAYADVTYGANYSAFNAFGADRSKVWADSGNSTLGHFIYYKFVNPICVKKFLIEQYVPSGGSERLSSVNLEASNDGTNWTSISSNINVHGRTDYTYLVDVNNDNYYLYYRIVIAGKLVADCILMRTLQFYGRSLNVSVPKMTSNTAPYGETSSSSDYSADVAPWKAMGYPSTGGWNSSPSSTQSASEWIQYTFTNPIVVKYVHFSTTSSSSYFRSCIITLQGSNDNFTSDVHDLATITLASVSDYVQSVMVNNNVAYSSYRLKLNQHNVYQGGHYYSVIANFVLCGVDYTERTDRTYLYDHGVEVVPLVVGGCSPTHGTESKEASRLKVATTNISTDTNLIMPSISCAQPINFTQYHLARVELDDLLSFGTSSRYVGINIRESFPCKAGDAYPNIASVNVTNDVKALDVSSVNGTYYFNLFANNYSTIGTINEWWLE